MITPSELRINNIILFNNQPIKIHGVRQNGVMLDGVLYNTGDPLHQFDYELIYAEDQRLQPLLLGDFLLEHFFVSTQINNRKVYRYHVPFYINYDGGGYFIDMYENNQLIHINPYRFQYYHQLQNLHFSQYGEELDVSLEILRDAWNLMVGRAR